MRSSECDATVCCAVCESNTDRELCRVAGYRIAQCPDCGFIFVNPRPSRPRLADLYRPVTNPFFSTSYEPIELEAAVLARVMRTIRRHVPGGTLLEVGCGRGDLLRTARSHGFTVVGCDFFNGRIPDGSNLSLVDGTLHDARFADATFDVVVIRNVLEHLFDPRSELDEVRRVLKPGGFLYTKVPNAQNGGGPFYRRLIGHPYPFSPPYHLSHFAPETLRGLLRGTGFTFMNWTVERPTSARRPLKNWVRQAAYHGLSALHVMSAGHFPQMTLTGLARKPEPEDVSRVGD
jgi:SAM-dependent methyltransferase